MAEDAAAADAALQLLRRLPPEAVVSNLGVLLNARPELTEELLSRVDQPLQVAADDAAGRDFLLCDYNRDADSYRCPTTSHLPFTPLRAEARALTRSRADWTSIDRRGPTSTSPRWRTARDRAPNCGCGVAR